MDSSGVSETFSSSVQEGEREGTASSLPSHEALLLCRREFSLALHLNILLTMVQTQQYVRMYNLSEQKLLKTLQPGIKWISSMDVHPSGDHLIVGGYDRKLCWFDLELSDKPYKVLR